MSRIVVTGASSGLGLAICKELLGYGHTVYGFDKFDAKEPIDRIRDSHYHLKMGDVRSKVDIESAFEHLGGVDIVINCVGVNCIDFLEDIEQKDWDRLLDTNAMSILFTSQIFRKRLKESAGTILNITSNASHMPMTSSLAYNASKAAADIMTKQLARELFPRHGITVFGIAPNKLSGTGMSDYIDNRVPEMRGWTFEEAKEYQLKGLAIGEETPPEALAQFIAHLLQDKYHHKYFHGCIIPFGL